MYICGLSILIISNILCGILWISHILNKSKGSYLMFFLSLFTILPLMVIGGVISKYYGLSDYWRFYLQILPAITILRGFFLIVS